MPIVINSENRFKKKKLFGNVPCEIFSWIIFLDKYLVLKEKVTMKKHGEEGRVWGLGGGGVVVVVGED